MSAPLTVATIVESPVTIPGSRLSPSLPMVALTAVNSSAAVTSATKAQARRGVSRFICRSLLNSAPAMVKRFDCSADYLSLPWGRYPDSRFRGNDGWGGGSYDLGSLCAAPSPPPHIAALARPLPQTGGVGVNGGARTTYEGAGALVGGRRRSARVPLFRAWRLAPSVQRGRLDNASGRTLPARCCARASAPADGRGFSWVPAFAGTTGGRRE